MAVFKDAMKVIAKAQKIEDTLSKAVDKVGGILDKIDDALERILGLLRTAIKALDTVASFIRSVAKSLRNNPAAKGVWKIVFTIAALILEGVAFVIEGLVALLRALRNATKGSLRKRIDRAIEFLFFLLGTYGKISAPLRNALKKLHALCVLLEKQQKKIESFYPTLRKTTNKNFLIPLDKLLDKLKPLADSLLDNITTLEKELGKLNAIAALLNGLDRLARALNGAVRNFLNQVNAFFQKVKQLILSIPFLGWLLDQLDKLIDWALDQLGVRAALRRLASAITNLPFVKRLVDFAAQLKALLETMLKKMEEIKLQIEEAQKQLAAIQVIVDKVIAMFSKLGVMKEKLEVSLPQNLEVMNNTLSDGLAALDDNDEERYAEAMAQYESVMFETHESLMTISFGLFGLKVQQTFMNAVEESTGILLSLAEDEELEVRQAKLKELTSLLQPVIKASNQLIKDVEPIESEYWAELNLVLSDLKVEGATIERN